MCVRVCVNLISRSNGIHTRARTREKRQQITSISSFNGFFINNSKNWQAEMRPKPFGVAATVQLLAKSRLFWHVREIAAAEGGKELMKFDAFISHDHHHCAFDACVCV